MESKKYSFLIGMFCLFASALSAQDGSNQIGTNYNILDSSVISNKNLPQFNEFRNNSYPFPPKPRSKWEFGLNAGVFNINGDVPSIPGFGFGAHLQKSLGYVFSLRLDYEHGMAKGLGWKPRIAGFSSPLIAAGYSGQVYDNYKTSLNDLSLDGVVTFNNIKFHKAKSNFIVYAMAGVGLTVFNAKVNVKNAAGANYNYSSITGGNIDDRKSTRDAIKNLLDNTYETAAEDGGRSEKKFLGGTMKPSANLGLGMAFRLGKRISLSIEDRFTYVASDLLDGQRWQNTNGLGNSRILTPGNDTYNYLSVGLNLSIGGKSVDPLWWINPLDYAYSELNTPKHMKFPKPILDDADGDGITDQFDREPNTPAGAAVDSHGVSRDTDGDGVPDYKDKELITPTQCQPVDADGVGKCPEPACCQTLDSLMKAGFSLKNACNLGNLPSVSFKGKSIAMSNDAKAVLSSVAESMKNNPNCKVAVVGYGESNKSAQQLSWDRVNTVINYLVEKEGISTDRFIFKYGEAGGDPNTVDIREASTDDTPNSASPSPNLRKRK
ncbi:MAG: OmpA family protein [Chitinophagaceae bacterium]